MWLYLYTSDSGEYEDIMRDYIDTYFGIKKSWLWVIFHSRID